MYSIKLDDESEKKTAKGIVRNVIKKHLKHENYKQILDSGGRMTSKMKMIRSFDHNVYTVDVTKISLSAYDDKRFIKEDGISSYAYGHFRINEHGE
jgi:intergrase/recombinase